MSIHCIFWKETTDEPCEDKAVFFCPKCNTGCCKEHYFPGIVCPFCEAKFEVPGETAIYLLEDD